MPDIAFNPTLSTNEVFRANDQTRFLTNDLNAIEADIEALETGKADSDHTHTGYAAAEHEHSGYSLTTHTHDGYALTSHTHTSDYIAKALQIIDDSGDVKYIFDLSDNIDLLAKIDAMPVGMHTVYSQSGVTNNPRSVEAWRFLVHKTATTNGWVLGFGSAGSIYANYRDANAWKGWRAIYNVGTNVLWSGNVYMRDIHTVTPSKTLSECRTGWMLLWSDYDADTSTVNDADFCTTMIPKFNPSGNAWDGKLFLCDIPRFYGSDTSDVSTEKRIMKMLYVHNDKLVGHVANNKDTRTDVVLRAVYEF